MSEADSLLDSATRDADASAFPMAPDLDAFREKLKGLIAADDESKRLSVTVIVAGVVFLLFVVAFSTFAGLKRFVRSMAEAIPNFINPCPQGGGWLAVSETKTCLFVPCAKYEDGQPQPPFYATQNECLASFPGMAAYPTAQTVGGVAVAVCAPQQGALPAAWSPNLPRQYIGANAMQQCQTDAASYNQNMIRLGVTCDPNNGPGLCAPVDSDTCMLPPSQAIYQTPQMYQTLSGCNQYCACDASQTPPAQVQKYSFPSTLAKTFPGLSPVAGACSVTNPCKACGGVSLNATSANQLAPVLTANGASIQPQNGASYTISAPGESNCTNPGTCCQLLSTQLNLPFALQPVQWSCAQGDYTCVADPIAAQNPAVCNSGNCYALVAQQQQTAATSVPSFFACQPVGQYSSNQIVFSDPAACQSAAAALNAPWLGMNCDAVNGAIACNTTNSGCPKAFSDILAGTDALSNPVPYLSQYGNTPTKLAPTYACASRQACDSSGNPSGACSFSVDTSTGLCNACPGQTGTCSQTGWVCSADPNAGAQCSLVDGSTTTIADACNAVGGSACGCACALPGQLCQSPNNVIGRPCDVPYPAGTNAGGAAMLPLSSVCGAAHQMQTAARWDVQNQMCVFSQPMSEGGQSFTLYLPPSQTPSPLCPTSPPDGWVKANSNTAGAILFQNQFAQANSVAPTPCPFGVYEACHSVGGQLQPILPDGAGGPVQSCSYNSFSGTAQNGAFASSQAMCLMTTVDMGDQSQIQPNVCISYMPSGDATGGAAFVVSGCLDAGGAGVLQGSAIPDAGSQSSGCGTCAATGSLGASSAQMCPLAPNAEGFTLL